MILSELITKLTETLEPKFKAKHFFCTFVLIFQVDSNLEPFLQIFYAWPPFWLLSLESESNPMCVRKEASREAPAEPDFVPEQRPLEPRPTSPAFLKYLQLKVIK